MQAVVRSILDKVWETGDIYKAKYEGGSNFPRPFSWHLMLLCIALGLRLSLEASHQGTLDPATFI